MRLDLSLGILAHGLGEVVRVAPPEQRSVESLWIGSARLPDCDGHTGTVDKDRSVLGPIGMMAIQADRDDRFGHLVSRGGQGNRAILSGLYVSASGTESDFDEVADALLPARKLVLSVRSARGDAETTGAGVAR